MTVVLSARVADDLGEWATTYAKSSGKTRQAYIEELVAADRQRVERGESRPSVVPVVADPVATSALSEARAEYARNVAGRQARLNAAKERASR